jgi:hypothetical protein
MQTRTHEDHRIPIRPVTRGPGHHFFGYYDKQQWDPTGRFLLGMRAAFTDRAVEPQDVLEIGMIDLQEGDRWIPLAETRAWCWQQGCMLQWRPGSQSQIIFNDRIDDHFAAVVLDVESGARRHLPRPIYALSNDGCRGLSLNFSRLAVTRPGYGYIGVQGPLNEQPDYAEDGVWMMDLTSGDHELIVNLEQVVSRDPDPSMDCEPHWVNHLLFAPGDERFIFLHRWRTEQSFSTRMFTAAADGGGVHRCPVEDASHFIWKDGGTILVWDDRPGGQSGYYEFADQQDDARLVADGVLTGNGHVTVSPDGRWLLTDEYPDGDGFHPVILYRIADGWRCDICRLHGPTPAQAELRCDFHPLWSRDGRQVCIDSIHEGSRQMYVADVSSIVS